MLSNKQAKFIRECIKCVCTRTRTALPPDDWNMAEWRGFLLKMGFKEHELTEFRAMELPMLTFKVGRSNMMTPEELVEAMRRR